jgi:hypothetical protein
LPRNFNGKCLGGAACLGWLRSFYLKPMNYIKKNEVVLLEWLLCIRRDISKVPSLFYRSLGAHFYLFTHLFVSTGRASEREVFSLLWSRRAPGPTLLHAD